LVQFGDFQVRQSRQQQEPGIFFAFVLQRVQMTQSQTVAFLLCFSPMA
jgi:hypothetical protein